MAKHTSKRRHPARVRVGTNIKTVARDHGITMRALAAECGWSEQTLHNKLSGATGMLPEDVEAIARAIDYPAAGLFADAVLVSEGGARKRSFSTVHARAREQVAC